MPDRRKGAFWLDHSLHTSFIQVEADHIGRKGLGDNVSEGFGHLYSIFSFARGDEMLSMLDIGRGKLWGMTPNSFGKERTLFGAKFEYGRWTNTSSLGNGFTRVTRIKERMVFCWVRERDLTMMVVRNQEVWELFQTQTYYLHVYICLYQQVMAIILWFDWDPSHQFKSGKTLSMVLLF